MPPDAGAQQGSRLQVFAASLLRHQGALVDAVEPEGLEVLAPPAVQDVLDVPEMFRLGFGSNLPLGGQRVGIEGDWLDRFARMLGQAGRWAQHVLPGPAGRPGNPEQLLGQELVLDNAAFRLLDVAPAWTRYLLLDFRASAMSDEKRDVMLQLGVNLATSAVPDWLVDALDPALDPTPDVASNENNQPGAMLPADAELPRLWDQARVLDLVMRALPHRLDRALDPFIRGQRRRLDRDQDRLHAYHNDLHREAQRRMLDLPEADPRRLREQQRCEAIAHEYRAKLDDLGRQYAMRVTVEWVQTRMVTMPVHRFSVQVRRRKSDRTILLDWNPVARRLEAPLCEASLSLERPRLVCDDALHLVMPAALGPCEECARPFCRACHRTNCPKCGGGASGSGWN